MSASESTPYGVKSLLKCISRATLLAQPDDIPEFLSTHVGQMTHVRDDESRDPKDVAFWYQEQWETIFLQEEHKWTKTLKPSADESPSSSVSSPSPTSFMVSLPEVRQKVQQVSLVRVPGCQESVDLTAEEKPRPVPPPPPPPPRGERVKTSSVKMKKQNRQNKTEPTLLSTWPVLPPIKKKAAPQISKQEKGEKSTKGRDSVVYTCRLIDCPYHIKSKEAAAVKGPVRTSKGPRVRRDLGLGLQESLTEPRSFEVHVPYRPKGGPIVDPELVPKKTRARTFRPTGAGSTLLSAYVGRDAVPEVTSSTDLCVSLDSSTHT